MRLLAVAGMSALVAATTSGTVGAAAADDGWTSTWSVAYEGSGGTFPARTTARQIVHTSIAGTAARLRLSNVFNTQPLTVTDFHLARRTSGSSVDASTDRPVTFGGQTSVTIPAGGQAVSDPVAFAVRAESDVAVSFYVPVLTQNVSSHQFAFENQYLADGNVTGAANIATTMTYSSYFIVSDLDVLNSSATGSVVALGASITEGHSTTFGANRRYPNLLASRLNASGRTVGVANEGIAGNQLLGVGVGPSALDRFDRDVLGRSGVRSVIFADNPINDLGSGREPTGSQLIAGLTQLITRAHAAGIKFHCATLTPFGGHGSWSSSREVARGQYNAFVRGQGSGCDGVVDFDLATRDPAAPTQFRAEFDQGDHLHPNDAGMAAMAAAIPLTLFGPAGSAPQPTTLAAAYDNVAVSNDTNTTAGNFDGGGASFSGQALAAGGAVAGKTVTTNGVALPWPASAGTGKPDNAIASGQTITVPGSGNTLALLHTTSYGPVSATGTINYTDGTTQSYGLSSPDWFVTQSNEATVAVVAAYQNRTGNVRFDQPSAVFSTVLPLAAGKTVATVRLPVAGGAPAQPGLPTLHIFSAVVTNRG